MNSDSTESSNLIKVRVYWGQTPAPGDASYFDIVKSESDFPSPLPLTGGSKVGPILILSLPRLPAL
ncbi:MAG: hypothetical protein IIZ04_03320 [Aeriscardovia sp.]|nr:hypothetical protein [Aeriscardovia sp.]